MWAEDEKLNMALCYLPCKRTVWKGKKKRCGVNGEKRERRTLGTSTPPSRGVLTIHEVFFNAQQQVFTTATVL